MRPDSVDLEELGHIASLATNDPERQRYEASPDKAALLLAYGRFLAAPEIDGARPDDAELEMRKFVAKEVASHASSAGQGSPGFLEWLSQLMRPAVLAPAAFVVILAFGATLWQSRQPDISVLRDADNGAKLVLRTAELLPDGGVRISWNTLVDAESYDVRLLTADLTEIDRIESISGTHWIISASALASLDELQFWQLIAMAGGDELQRSSIETLK